MYPPGNAEEKADYASGNVCELSVEPPSSGGDVDGVAAGAVDVGYNVVPGNYGDGVKVKPSGFY